MTTVADSVIIVKRFVLQHLGDGIFMFEKNMRIAYLLDFYGEALDEHTLGVMKAYYNEDLSLSEIADGVGISRQGIRHLIKKGEDQLEFYESHLALAKRHEELEAVCGSLSDIACKLGKTDEFKKDADEISRLIEIILKGN